MREREKKESLKAKKEERKNAGKGIGRKGERRKKGERKKERRTGGKEKELRVKRVKGEKS